MIYNGEVDVLEIRLHELDAVVDRFVIVEADITFSGQPKELQFNPAHPAIAPFAGKIDYLVVRDSPDTSNPWEREIWQRNAILRGIRGAGEDDLIIMSDVDEIVKESIIAVAKDDQSHPIFYFELSLLFFC